MRKLSLLLALVLAVSASSATAATKKPTPTPTPKTTAKATAKATTKATTKATLPAKPSAKSTAKSTSTPTTKSSAKPVTPSSSASTSTSTAKPTVKPKPKPKPRKSIGVEKSPPPKWPPVGFDYEAGIYAKIPTVAEMTGINSASKYLSNQVKACKKFACGRVLVASESGCLWWEVNSKVYGQNKELIGDLRSIAGSSVARQVKPIILLTPEPLETLEYVSVVEVVCHQEARPEGTQSVTFTKVNK